LEDFLSILVVILIAVATTSKKNKKKKAKAPDSKGPVSFSSSDTQKGFSEMKDFVVDVGKTILEMDDDDEIDAPAKTKPMKLKAKKSGAAKVAAKSAKPAVTPAKPRVTPAASARSASVIEEGLGEATVSTQGYSLFEDRGCIGGSLSHDSHEGDMSHVYDMDRYDESLAYAGDVAREIQSMDIARLRRAVVISEILDKPKALRRR